jgi:uncharacterized protein
VTNRPGQQATSGDFVVLITAKAPVAGLVKTRLTPPLTPDQAAQLAAVSLVDTIATAHAAVGGRGDRVVLSLSGELDAASWPTLAAAATRCTVIDQVGETFGERLRDAHERASTLYPGRPVVQVGMDTPQVAADDLTLAATHLQQGLDAVLGLAWDGGWWLLGLLTPAAAAVLAQVPMSSPATGHLTYQALVDRGLAVAQIHTLTDIDTYDDAVTVRAQCHGSHYAAAFDALARP